MIAVSNLSARRSGLVRPWLVTFVALAVAGTSATAGHARSGPANAPLTDLDSFVDGVMAQQIASREVAGAVVTVVADGKMLFSRGYGMADIDKNGAVDGLTTLVRPGSISKMFTWIALLQQVEQGRVDLDADVNRYIDFRIEPFQGQPIRVRDLLSHSPGMSDVGNVATTDPAKVVPYEQWLKQRVPARLWPPGTEISYSNWGAALAGYIVERVSGEPFADYAEKHILVPLGMTSSTFREPLGAPMANRMATGYKLIDGRFVAQPVEYLAPVMPAGSLTASGPDVARFMLALINDGALGKARIASRASIALLESNSLANAPDLPPMAHGFLVYRQQNPRLVGHAGKTIGFSSDLIYAPDRGIGFFVSTTGGKDSGKARTELSQALVGRFFPTTPAPRYTGDETPPLGVYRVNRRDYAEEATPAYDLIVSQPTPHRLTIENDGVKTAWEQIGPQLYEKVTGARLGGPFEQVQFYTNTLGARLSYASQPFMTYRLVEARRPVAELPSGNRP